jgi:hypothetical protein
MQPFNDGVLARSRDSGTIHLAAKRTIHESAIVPVLGES